MPPPGETDLRALARRLAKDGPVKVQYTPKRIRILLNGAYIADTEGTSGALLVWEHAYYPQLYLPNAAFKEPEGFDVIYTEDDKVKNEQDKVIATIMDVAVRPHNYSMDVDDDDEEDVLDDETPFKNCWEIIHFAPNLDSNALSIRDMWKVKFDGVDGWFEEDTPIFVHPKDPYKRVDTISSTRRIKVAVNGQVVADTSSSVHLYETGLPVRYYMPLTAINGAVLRPSKTRTQCPYKGEAEYYSVVVNDQEFKDVVWFYTRPTIECAAVAGLCCFYNEKVDIAIMEAGEWNPLERPKTPWS